MKALSSEPRTRSQEPGLLQSVPYGWGGGCIDRLGGGGWVLIFIVVVNLFWGGVNRADAGLAVRRDAGQRADKKAGALRERVRSIYMSQVGVREANGNTGPEVEKYLRYVNLPKGNPWCAAFVCWVYGEAGVENPKSGWSPDLFEDSKMVWLVESGKLKIESGGAERLKLKAGGEGYKYQSSIAGSSGLSPGPGDIFGLYFPEKKRIAHVGFIDSWDGTWAVTVEGNTNRSGSREGDGVYRKRRLVRTIDKVAGYIRAK